MATHYTCDFCGRDVHAGRTRVDLLFISEYDAPASKRTPNVGLDLCGRCSSVTRRFLNGKARVIHIHAFEKAIADVRALDLGTGDVNIENVLRILVEALEKYRLDLIQDENAG